jgi:hypothetical protein
MTSSMATGIQVVIDCADPARLAEFWAAALGYTPQPPPSGFGTWPEFLRARGVPESDWNSANAVIDPGQRGPRLFFQRVPEEKTVKNRVHLDLNLGGGPGTALETGSYPCSRPCWLARSSTWTMPLPHIPWIPGVWKLSRRDRRRIRSSSPRRLAGWAGPPSVSRRDTRSQRASSSTCWAMRWKSTAARAPG